MRLSLFLCFVTFYLCGGFPMMQSALQELLDPYVSDLSDLAPASARIARVAFENYSAWFTQTTGEEWSLDNLAASDVREWQHYLVTIRKYKPNTANAYLLALRQFANWATDAEHLTRNPLHKKVKTVKEVEESPRALEREEEARLLRAIEQESPTTRFMILFLLHTGMRVGEFVALELDDVFLGEKRQALSVLIGSLPKAKDIRAGEVRVRAGKGMKARTLPLNATAREALLDYLAVRPHVESPRLLISSKFREPMTAIGVRKLCQRLQHTARIPDLHPHLLRATFGTKLARREVPIERIAELMGHSDTKTTRKYYLAINQGQLAQDVARIEE